MTFIQKLLGLGQSRTEVSDLLRNQRRHRGARRRIYAFVISLALAVTLSTEIVSILGNGSARNASRIAISASSLTTACSPSCSLIQPALNKESL